MCRQILLFTSFLLFFLPFPSLPPFFLPSLQLLYIMLKGIFSIYFFSIYLDSVCKILPFVAQSVKTLPAVQGTSGSIPELGRSPGEGNGNPLQYRCLGNLMDRGAWWVEVYGVANGRARLSD